MLTPGFPIHTLINYSILHLKVIILSQFDISGLREFQSLTMRGKKLFFNTSVFTDGGMK